MATLSRTGGYVSRNAVPAFRASASCARNDIERRWKSRPVHRIPQAEAAGTGACVIGVKAQDAFQEVWTPWNPKSPHFLRHVSRKRGSGFGIKTGVESRNQSAYSESEKIAMRFRLADSWELRGVHTGLGAQQRRAGVEFGPPRRYVSRIDFQVSC